MLVKKNLSLGVAILLTICAAITASADENRNVLVPSVTIARVAENSVIVRTPVTGTLVPFEDIQVNTELNGLAIMQVLAEVGDFVAAGDTLLILDERLHEAQLAQANAETVRANASERQAISQVDTADANLTQAEASLSRATRLKEMGNISQQNFEQAVTTEATARAALVSAQNGVAVAAAQILVAEAQRELAELNLSRTHIRAPASGLVSDRSAFVGAIAAAGGSPLFLITKDGTIEIEVEVIETALGGIKLGDTSEF